MLALFLSTETFQTGRKWSNIFKAIKDKKEPTKNSMFSEITLHTFQTDTIRKNL